MTYARQIVADWMLLRGYAPGDGDTIQALLFEIEAQAKGRGGPPEPPPGEGDFKLLQAENERLRAALKPSPGDVGAISIALSLFANAIKSGERWTPTCEDAQRAAYVALCRLAEPRTADEQGAERTP